MALEWIKEEKSNGQVGQFSFRIPAAPLQPGVPFIRSVNDVLQETGLRFRVRVQTQNQILFAGLVEKLRLTNALNCARTLSEFQSSGQLPSAVVVYVSIGVGSRIDWSGYLSQPQIDNIVRILRGEVTDCSTFIPPASPGPMIPVCPPGYTPVNGLCIPGRASYRYRGLFGTPNTLGDVAAGVSVGGGLIGLAILGLAGYAIYKLAT